MVVNAVFTSLLKTAVHEAEYHKIVFSDRACQRPVFIPTDRQELSFELVDPQWTGFRAYARGYIPIIRWAHVYRVKTADADRPLFFAPSMWYEAERLGARPDDDGFRVAMFWLSVMSLGASLALLIRRPWSPWWSVLGVLLLRLTFLFWSYSMFGFFTVDSGDEVRYLHTAYKLLDWSYVLPDTRYTIGNPLLYVPMILLRPAGWTEFGFIGSATIAHFLIFGLGALILWMYLVRRMSRSLTLSVWSGLALVLYPWLWRVFHVPAMDDGLFSFVGLWLSEPLEKTFIDFYYATNLIGYNALSDTPAMAFALMSLLLLHRSVGRGTSCFWAGLVFGCSVLIRITNVFLLLPVAVLLLGGSYRRLLTSTGHFVAGAVLSFAPQLLWNHALFGDALLFGYQLIEEDAKGFELANFVEGVRIIGNVFQQLLAFSALALVVVRRHFGALTTVLAACIVPLLVFYAGYHAITICPVRFVLTPVCAMVLACVLLFRIAEARPAALACLALAVLVVPGKPYAAFVVPIPWWVAPALACAVAVALCLWRRPWPFVAYCAIVAVGSPVLTFAVVCVVGIWVVVRGLLEERAVVELRERFLTRSACEAGRGPTGDCDREQP